MAEYKPELTRWFPTMTSNSGVPYSIEVDEGVIEGIAEDGPHATVKFRCEYGRRFDFVSDLVGKPMPVGSGLITYIPPAQYPPSPNLYCRPNIRVEGKGHFRTDQLPPIIGWPNWTWAIITAEFGIPTWPPDGDASGRPWTKTSISPSGETFAVPDSVFRFADGTPLIAPMGLPIASFVITMARHWMPYLPLAQMAALTGKTNNADFAVATKIFPAGYLVFVPGESEDAGDFYGTRMWDQEYKFAYREVGWNNAIHPNGTTGWAPITDVAGNPPYPPGDFTTLP